MELISSSRRCMGECAGWGLNGKNILQVCDRLKTPNLVLSKNLCLSKLPFFCKIVHVHANHLDSVIFPFQENHKLQ